MKKIYTILLINVIFIHISNSQTLIQQIENAYNALDTVFYIENLRLSFKEKMKREHKEFDDMSLKYSGVDYNNMDSIQKKDMFDYWEKYKSDNIERRKRVDPEFWIEEQYNEFNTKISI